MRRYSALSLLRNGLAGNRHWQRAWRAPEPKRAYDVIIVGAGGHGLATAFYLAENHGIRNVAVLEKNYVGGGNVGRNTTVIRSNYLLDGNTQFYEFSMQLWEGMSRALNFNVMFSQRGQIVTAHSADQLDGFSHRANIMRLNGLVSTFPKRRAFRSTARSCRAGRARHDTTRWPGVMRAQPTATASTSSRIAK
jgi:methylglutamate dehydrogenase subunit A